MEKEKLAERYVARLKKCLLCIKIFVFCAIPACAALLIFIAVAAATEMQNSNLAGLITGVAVTGFFALGTIIAAFICVIIAKVNLVKLEKLGAVES